MDNLIREDDRAVFGDKGYANEKKKREAGAAGVYWAVKAKAKPGANSRSHKAAAIVATAPSAPRSSMCSAS